MTLPRSQRIAFAITTLLFASLACRAATRLIIPDTPTPVPTATFIPTVTPTLIPTITPTIAAPLASCPLVTSKIINDATSSNETALNGASTSNKDVTYIVQYQVSGDEIKNPHFESVPNKYKTEQKDFAAHEEIWKFFTRLIPANQRALLDSFSIFTDGKYNILAAVNQSDKSPYNWELNVDFADTSDKPALTFTLLHEFGHLLTLNSNQEQVSQAIYQNPDSEKIYNREVAACPQYFTGEGCSKPDSYINQFFDRFWLDFYAEWQKIDQIKNEDTKQSKLDDFYKTYQDQFLTDYAPTSPAEDIAESWAFFILAPKPEDNSIANEKILFFYEYPELVQLREQILSNVCGEFQQ